MGLPFWTVKKLAATSWMPVCWTYELTLRGHRVVRTSEPRFKTTISTYYQCEGETPEVERLLGAWKLAGCSNRSHA